MERMLVVVVDTEAQAYDACRALEDLNEEGQIALYVDAVVTKNPDGTTTTMKGHDARPLGTLGGTAVGSLIGLLGGPVGLAVGAASGLFVGASTDFVRSRIAKDFVADVANALTPGRAAVVAEIDEECSGPLDARMHALSGFVFRSALSDVANEEYEAERINAVKQRYNEWLNEMASQKTDGRK